MSRGLWWLSFGAFIVGFVFAWLVFNWATPVRGQPPDVSSGSIADAPRGEDETCSAAYGRFVGLHEGRVAVFAGTPDGCRVLLAVPMEEGTELLPFQLQDLHRGVVFTHDDELFQILEGLAAP